jgi:hypothetical protein
MGARVHVGCRGTGGRGQVVVIRLAGGAAVAKDGFAWVDAVDAADAADAAAEALEGKEEAVDARL